MNFLPGRSFRSINYLKLGLIVSLLTFAGAESALGLGINTAAGDVAPSDRIPQAIESARVEQKLKQSRQIRADNYDLQRHPVTDAQEQHWKNILWTTAIVEPQDSYVVSALGGLLSLSRQSGLTAAQKRTIEMAFQIGTQLYLDHPEVYGNVGQQFLQTVEQSPSPDWVAMALSVLAKSNLPPTQIQQLSNRVRQRFPQWSQNAVLLTTLQDVQNQLAPPPLPPLKDLLNWTIAPGQMQVYVICSSNRKALCTAVLKNPQGTFVRTTSPMVSANGTQIQQGKLWSVPLLLRSIHGLNWNFTRGQTPQGIYRIEGLTPQPDHDFFRAYGQFPLVNLYLPFESGSKSFLPGRSGPFLGNLQSYQALLPPTWRQYTPMQQSYWAGRIGRGLFRVHGSGEAADFFHKSPSDREASAWNPTLGCLSALEIYDQNGKLQQADMPKILSALRTASGRNLTGYLIVVEMPRSLQNPPTAEEIEAALN